jgi:hypothetical protein
MVFRYIVDDRDLIDLLHSLEKRKHNICEDSMNG